MPLTPRVEKLRARRSRWAPVRDRIWREWCFARAVGRRLGGRLFLILVLLLGGGLSFQGLEPEKHLPYPRAIYNTFSLIFAQPAEEFPEHWFLQVLYFAVPIVGLTVVIESMVELSQILRDRRSNERAWSESMAASLSDHVILVGLGRLGWRTHNALRGLGIPMVVIDLDDKGEFLEDVRRNGTPVLIGDARREAFLEDAGIRRARAIILATNDDLANLEVALDARNKRPEIRVVLRMFDQNMADKVHHGFNIRAALSTAALAAPTFAAAAIIRDVVATTVLDDQLVLMVNYQVGDGDPWSGKTVGELTEKLRLGVVRLAPQKGPTVLFPPPGARIGVGDKLVVQGVYDQLLDLAIART